MRFNECIIKPVSLSYDSHMRLSLVHVINIDKLTNRNLGFLGPPSLQGVPNPRLPRLHYKFVWERLSHPATPPVFRSSQRPKASLCWTHWIPKYRQI